MAIKKLLIQLDTDAYPSAFDIVTAYDAGVDHVLSFGGIHPNNARTMVEGAIFTRGPRQKKYTAIFIGGSVLAEGEQLMGMLRSNFFFADFRVSLMLDSNGSNTTAASGVHRILQSVNGSLAGKRAVVLAGTGPVGQRAAYMLASEGARVRLSSRSQERGLQACRNIKERFQVEVEPAQAVDHEQNAQLVKDAQIIFSAGAAGVELLKSAEWQDNPGIEVIVDANATPPLGIEGIKSSDANEVRHGKKIWGALGFGSFKLKLQRYCIERLFERNDLILDATQIYNLAREIN